MMPWFVVIYQLLASHPDTKYLHIEAGLVYHKSNIKSKDPESI